MSYKKMRDVAERAATYFGWDDDYYWYLVHPQYAVTDPEELGSAEVDRRARQVAHLEQQVGGAMRALAKFHGWNAARLLEFAAQLATAIDREECDDLAAMEQFFAEQEARSALAGDEAISSTSRNARCA